MRIIPVPFSSPADELILGRGGLGDREHLEGEVVGSEGPSGFVAQEIADKVGVVLVGFKLGGETDRGDFELGREHVGEIPEEHDLSRREAVEGQDVGQPGFLGEFDVRPVPDRVELLVFHQAQGDPGPSFLPCGPEGTDEVRSVKANLGQAPPSADGRAEERVGAVRQPGEKVFLVFDDSGGVGPDAVDTVADEGEAVGVDEPPSVSVAVGPEEPCPSKVELRPAPKPAPIRWELGVLGEGQERLVQGSELCLGMDFSRPLFDRPLTELVDYGLVGFAVRFRLGVG
jgi:hypothetical protein